MIIESLGPSLKELKKNCSDVFSLHCTYLIAKQLVILCLIIQISRLEYIHSKDYIHRDIKPENFLIGRQGNERRIYAIDFGLSTLYKDSLTHYHLPFSNHRSLVGTARYVSINTHSGISQSRRDDLEAIGYMLMHFILGQLPWQGLNTGSGMKYEEDQYTKVMENKISFLNDENFYNEYRNITYYYSYIIPLLEILQKSQI